MTCSVDHPAVRACLDVLSERIGSDDFNSMDHDCFLDSMSKSDRQLLLIAGRKRHGKDTLAENVSDLTDGQVTRIAFADPLKDIIMEATQTPREWLYGSESEKEMKRPYYQERFGGEAISARDLSQTFGTEGAHQAFGTDVWVNAWAGRAANAEHPLVVVPDLRFPSEADMAADIRSIGPTSTGHERSVNARVWRYDRLFSECQTDGHVSEQDLPKSVIDMERICGDVEDNRAFAGLVLKRLGYGVLEGVSA